MLAQLEVGGVAELSNLCVALVMATQAWVVTLHRALRALRQQCVTTTWQNASVTTARAACG